MEMQYKHFRLFFAILLSLGIIQAGCRSPEPAPTQVPAKTLPPTWTDEPTIEVLVTPEPIASAIPSPTHQPSHNWWAVGLEQGRNLRVEYARETSNGGILIWAQIRDREDQAIQDQLIYLQDNGFPAWKRDLSPANARIQFIQEMEDGTLLLIGYQQDQYLPHPFYIHLTENGEILASNVYRGMVEKPDRYYLQTPSDSNPSYFGKIIVMGELPGSHYVTAYSSHSEGGMTVMGSIHGPITSGGATFSYLRGIWVIRFDNVNKIVWQRFFQTPPAGPFFKGVILADGSILVTTDQTDYLSILKLDPDGYTTYWRHYSSIVSVQSLSGGKDGSVIIAASRNLVKLDPRGEVIWSKELVVGDNPAWIQYAFQAGNGDLILFLDSGNSGVIVARFNMEQPFVGCAQMQFEDLILSKHIPLIPKNIGGSLRVTPFPSEMVDWTTNLTLNETSVEAHEICRFLD